MLDGVVGLAPLDDELLVVADVALQPLHPRARVGPRLALLLIARLVILSGRGHRRVTSQDRKGCNEGVQ